MSAPQENHTDAILSAVLETTDDMICVVDAKDLGLLAFNSALARYFDSRFGKTLRIGARLEDVLDAEGAALWRGLFDRAVNEGPFSVAHRGLVHGQPLWLSFNTLVKDGRCFAISSFARDITHFERAVKAAQNAEERFEKVFRQNPFPLLVTTADRGIILDANQALADLVGRKCSDLIGRPSADVGLWDDVGHRTRLVEAMRVSGRIEDFPTRYRRANGEVLHGLLACQAINLDGIDCYLVSVADVTPLRNAEQALRESELRYRALIENAPEAIVLIDADTCQRVDANENADRDFGHGQSAIFGPDSTSINPPAGVEGTTPTQTIPQRMAQAAKGQTQVFEWVHTRPDGKVVNCEVRMSPFPDPSRRLVRASIIDIEDRKRAEREAAQLRAQLEQAQRLDSLGTLAGGIAHDFNNILCSIVGYAELALMHEKDAQVRCFIESIERGADRAKELVGQVLAFSRQAPHQKKPVRVAGIVEEAVKLLRVALPATVVVNQHYDSSGWVMTDPIQIHQVVMNLGTNAGLAMRDQGGTLDVEVTEVALDEQAAAQHPGLQPCRHLSLTVRDTGCGIAPENIERIFEPFFTTRPKGEGTGLGLSVVYGIVKEAGGAILVNSALGSGTTFQVLLPLCPQTAVEDAPTVKGKTGGKQCVLFVDDDPTIVRMTEISLGQLGYEVNTFTDPSQAIEEFSRRAARFDVLVTDATLPKMTGARLAAVIRKLRPDIPMILISGSDDRRTHDEAQAAGFGVCLSKPYRPTELARAIQDLCQTRPSKKRCS